MKTPRDAENLKLQLQIDIMNAVGILLLEFNDKHGLVVDDVYLNVNTIETVGYPRRNIIIDCSVDLIYEGY